MIRLGHGNDLHQSIRLWREGGGGKSRRQTEDERSDCSFCSAAISGHQRPPMASSGHAHARAEADIETGSFLYQACVVP